MQGYKTIVVGTDFSSLADRSLRVAAELAGRFDARRFHLVHVVHTSGAVLPQLIAEARSQEAQRRQVESAETRLEALEVDPGIARVTREVRVGSPARELSRVSDELHADLVVVASHGHSGLARLVLGSAASSLIRTARCPVLVVGDKGPASGRFENVVAAVDLSPISRNVLQNALTVARAGAGRVRVLSLFEHPLLAASEGLLPLPMSQEEVESLGEHHRAEVAKLVRWLPTGGLEVTIDVRSRAPAPQGILEVARAAEADLIVLGTSGGNAWHRMIVGSTTHHVLVKAPCPVLVVPQEEREPVKDSVMVAGGVLEPGS